MKRLILSSLAILMAVSLFLVAGCTTSGQTKLGECMDNHPNACDARGGYNDPEPLGSPDEM